MQNHTATYSPEDNKLRIYPACRLAREDYDRVRAAGFIWAPKQEIFVAPMWTPAREDLAVEMCGEIGDEDKSLVERAEERAERFEDYSESRAQDAESARSSVSAIADNIPFGQPILVGHHSERHARKDAERIENGMRKAVKMWETSQYWQYRAEGALANAKYKELPAVRARRIKGIEADKRKREKASAEADKFSVAWRKVQDAINAGDNDQAHKMALAVANYDHVSAEFPVSHYPRAEGVSTYEGMQSLWSALDGGIIGAAKAAEIALRVHNRGTAHRARWIAHYSNRLAYERAMLGESGGEPADKWAHVKIGGRVLVRGEWVTILRVNRKAGKVCSVSTNARYVSVRQVEDIKDYEAPAADVAELAKEVSKLPPMCNYPGDGFKHMTKAEYNDIYKDYKGGFEAGQGAQNRFGRVISGAPSNVGRHRVRAHMTGGSVIGVYLTDQKRTDPPKIEDSMSAPPVMPAPERDISDIRPAYKAPAPTIFDGMKESLRAGVQVVTANQLFPTPATLAARMVELAEISAGQCVLEPSAGTGNLVSAVLDAVDTEVLAYEINQDLSARLSYKFPSHKLQVRCKDFLSVDDFMGQYERVIMNPPFENGSDIRHIEHAVKFLRPGGRLVAICANGPRQREKLMPLADQWHDLPPGTFAESGTMVNSALLVINA